ncbi:MAG: T9SS type A sorting domain-containing protein [Crocinitomix sp.]|nr:T9SS type A sorting domain-containing protein [Crocinitomix sp.]
MKIIIALLTLFTILNCSFGQDAFCKEYSHQSKFNQTYLTKFSKCLDGGYVVVAMGENSQMELMRTDENGNVLWAKTYGGAFYGYGNSILESSTGDIFFNVTIKDTSSILLKGVHRLFKVNSYGELQWTKDIQFSESHSVAESIVELDGYLYVIGHGRDDSYFYSASITKMDLNGNVIWQKSYAGETDETIPVEAVATLDNGVIIACQAGLGSILFKIDSDGTVQWFKRIHEDYLSQVKDIELTSNNELLITGLYREIDACSWHDIFAMRLSADGEHIWGNIYSATSMHLHARSIHESNDGGAVIVGQQEESWDLIYPILIRTNDFGFVNSVRALRPEVSSTAVSSVMNNDGSLTILGTNGRSTHPLRQTMLTRTNTEFITTCDEEIISLNRQPFSNNISNTYTVSDFSSILTTTTSSEDYLITSSELCAIEDDSTAGTVENIQETIKNFNCYPNPTIDRIYFTVIPEQVTIFDMTGRELFRATNVATIDLIDYPIGNYIVHQEFQGYSMNQMIFKE